MQRKSKRLRALALALLVGAPLLIVAVEPCFWSGERTVSLGESALPLEPPGSLEEEPPPEEPPGEAEPGEVLSEGLDARLESHERLVATYAELEAALKDEAITHIYLDDDITITSGIQINHRKSMLVIDGTSPADGVRHTLTEGVVSSITGTLYLNTTGGTLKEITLRNLDIQGVNYYGPVNIYDTLSGVALRFENVFYQGPQPVFNRRGSVHFQDSEFQIGKFGRTTDIGELAECPIATFAGEVTVTQMEEYTHEIFYITELAGSIEFLPGSRVTVTTLGDSGFLHTSRKVTLTVREDAVFTYNCGRRFWEATPLQSFQVLEGGQVFMRVTQGPPPNGFLRIDGDLTVARDAVFHLYSTANSVNALLVITNGSITFDDPLSVVLHQPSASIAPIYFNGSAGTLSITAEQVNYWRTAGPGGFDDLPLYSWRMSDGSDLSISGTVTVGSAGKFSNLNTNYDGDDPAPDLTTFNLNTMRVLACGRFPLTAGYLTTHIGGSALPEATLRATYDGEAGEIPAGTGTADEEGDYRIPLAEPLPGGLVVLVEGTGWHLYGETLLTTGAALLQFASQPERIVFESTEISPSTQLVPRTDSDWTVSVLDTRGAGSSWQLYVGVRTPLTPQLVPAGHATPQPLHGALVFADQYGNAIPLGPEADTLVFSHTTTEHAELTTVHFGKDAGVLARIAPGTAHTGLSYHGALRWVLIDAP